MYFKGQLLKDTHEFPKTLIDSLQNGQVIPFVGAGVSRAIQNKDTGKPLFPNWKELLLKAAERPAKEQKTDYAKAVEGLAQIDCLDAAKRAHEGLFGTTC
jgi:hypothetical protein